MVFKMQNTKHTLVLLLTATVTLGCMAQKPERGKNKEHCSNRPRVEELVKDLSDAQKSKLEKIRKESSVKELRQQYKAVRDSARTLMNRPGDNTKELFPLFEREGRLQTEIDKEMYRSRLKIDEILTDDQRKELRTNMEARKKEKKHPPMVEPNKQLNKPAATPHKKMTAPKQ